MMQAATRRPRSPRQAAARRGPVDALLDPALFKALGDPTRVKLLACLIKCGRACSVGEVAECCSVDLSVVSRHLAVLERAGSVTSEKKGRAVFYAAQHERLATILRDLADAIQACGGVDGCCGSGGCRGK